MNIIELAAGTKLELEMPNNHIKGEKLVFISEFEFTEDESIFYVAAPIYQGSYYPVHRDTHLNICAILIDSIYNFDAKVLERVIKDDFKMLKLKAVSDLQRIQRREFFRFECLLPVEYRVVNSDKNTDSKYKRTIAKNLSGGGICLKLTESLELNDQIECRMILDGNEIIGFNGKIVRIERTDLQQKYVYLAGIKFTDITDKARRAVISFIFEKQRKMREKGLI